MKSLLVALCLSILGFGSQTIYEGEFSGKVSSVGHGCESIFSQQSYRTRFFLTGTGYTAVVHFTRADQLGFFHGMNLVGNYDGSGVSVDKKYVDGKAEWRVHAEGLVDYEFLILKVTVSRYEGPFETCRSESDYSGFTP